MRFTAVIMAGGVGERFWPKSRQHCPKQFLSLTSDRETMIQKTVKRLTPLVSLEDIYIITNADYLTLVHEQLPQIPPENVIAEPCPRNTAPAIGLVSSLIAKKYQDAVMFFLPSDHLIHDEQNYIDTLRKAADAALQDKNLITLGIKPTYPETGYGYIQYQQDNAQDGIYSVERFVEKPDSETAESYLASGNYLWNSGMFIWKASSILYNIEKYMPDLYQGLQPIKEAYLTEEFNAVLNQQFPLLPSESIDFGVMEKAEHILTIPGDFGWDDVGSWLALERINQTDENYNLLDGNIISLDSHNCTVSGNGRLIAMLGIEDLVIVDTNDALLICHKNQTQEIKKILAQLKEQQQSDLL